MDRIANERLWVFGVVILGIVICFFSGRIIDTSENIIKKLKLGWLIKGLMYAFLVALIPGAIWLFGGLACDILRFVIAKAVWFWGLSWSIKIPVYILLGLCIQAIMYLRKREENN